jgi:hypothetical protein
LSGDATQLRSRLAHVLWLGGISGVGKTTAARSIARRYDIRLYSMDSRTYEHAAKLPADTRTFDEIWVDSSPEELADWFEDVSRARFPLVVDDLLGLQDDAPVIVDGPQLLPAIVAPLLRSPEQALYVIAQPRLQRRLIIQRGSLTTRQTRDSERARENRLQRDELLVQRLLGEAREHRLPISEVAHVRDTEPLVERHFEPLLSAWLARGDRGDVSARRRDENDARLRQWRAYDGQVPEAAEGEVDLACECAQPGCTQIVRIELPQAEAARAARRAFVAASH